jgi:hypothetical protein
MFRVIYTHKSNKMPKGGAWSNSNKSRMLSNVHTDQNQGGGDKKAGFPYQIGREHWTSLFLHTTAPITGRCCNRGNIATTMVFTKNTVRPTGNDPRIPMR